MNVVIAGAGQAGAWVARSLREHAPGARIVLVGEEVHPPYERPPLSKAVLAGVESAPPCLLSTDQALAMDIDLRLGVQVSRIDRQGRAVALSTGESLGYDKLVIATGGRARMPDIPGLALPGVHVLRTWDDAARIQVALNKPGCRLLVLGGGWIGLEVAATARQLGAEVTLLEGGERLCSRAAPPVVSEHLLSLHRSQGVDVRFGSSLTGIKQNDDGSLRALTNLDPLNVDLVLIGIGLVPETVLALECGLEVDNGIVVDASGRTSDADIYAAGDVANQPSSWAGAEPDARIRLESWANAQNQGIAVGKALAGLSAQAADVPWFWSDQYGLNLQVLGMPCATTPYLVRGDMASGKFCLFQFEGDRLRSVVAGNASRELKSAKRWMKQGVFPKPEQLLDPAFVPEKFKG